MAKGRKESMLSWMLGRSMNMLCKVFTYEELIQYQKLLDEQDDLEHKKMKGLFYEKTSMELHFQKRLDLIINNGGGDLKELKKEMVAFQNSYEKRLKKIMDIRKYLEEEDDRVRQLLFEHTEKCKKRLREENNSIEQSMISENINKKKLASVATH